MGQPAAFSSLPVYPSISLVIPVRDEAANVGRLAAEIRAAMHDADLAWEAIWVDDGSSDSTAREVLALPPPHRLLQLDRPHGQSAALAAGFRAARGDWVGTLDGDGQNDPKDLVLQLAFARATGADMVNGVRAHRHDGVVRRLSSRFANGIRNAFTSESVTDVGCSTRVMRREALVELPFFDGMHRFLPTLVRMRGYTVSEVPVNHRARHAGRSKYGIGNRLWRSLEDLFGVRWLLRRQRVWTVIERSPDTAPAMAPAVASAARLAPSEAGDRRNPPIPRPVGAASPTSVFSSPVVLIGALVVLLAIGVRAAAGPLAGSGSGAADGTPFWPWLALGFAAQGVFGARFLVQWISSERAGASVVPRAFWILSLIGGLSLLAYFIHRRDPVGVTGQLFGVIVYLRNLSLGAGREPAASRNRAAVG